jgi:predicted Rossmann fold flavoprotein
VVGLAPEEGGWRVEFDGAPPARARAVIVATGGLSVPATGSDGRGLALVESLGHRVTPTYPALTPLTADPHPHASLAGVSARVTLSAPSARPAFEATDALLVTHRGWSGPAVLDASHVAIRGAPGGGRQEILVRWTDLDERVWDERLTGGSGTVRSAVGTVLAKRLVDELLRGAGVEPDTRLAQLKRTDRAAVARALGAYPLPWTGDEGYKKAEVTGGGVHLAEVDPRTMESRRRPGLYLCGEILDAFGPIGGHNFLWAFATGRAAGAAV